MTLRQAEDFDWTSIWEKEWHEDHNRYYTCKTGDCLAQSAICTTAVYELVIANLAGSSTSGAIGVTPCALRSGNDRKTSIPLRSLHRAERTWAMPGGVAALFRKRHSGKD
jgi:hypothetical protein